jgi:beta-galactosidase
MMSGILLQISVCLLLAPLLLAKGADETDAPFKLNDPDDFLYFFQNVADTQNLFTFEPQYKLALQAGVDHFTFEVDCFPWDFTPQKPDWSASDAAFSLYAKESRTALLAPRIHLTPSPRSTPDFLSRIVWQDGPSDLMSWADPKVEKAASDAVASFVEHYEHSRFGSQIWAYHLAARQTGEWISDEFITHGPDRSEADEMAFREWLKNKYRTDEGLQMGWHNPGISLEKAAIPPDTEHRFPMRMTPDDQVVEAFYKLPEEQPWVDFSEFSSDLTAGCIKDLAKRVKKSCSYKKAVIVFYGYVFNLPGSISGHLKAAEVLKDPDIDFMAAPISYSPFAQRMAGGVGAPMSAVDSLALHGKTWINEDDLATHAQDKNAIVPDWYAVERDPTIQPKQTADLAETQGVLKRNLAFAAFHHAATWWMDLFGGGWFSDPKIWNIWQNSFGQSLRKLRTESTPYLPQVAIIVDEHSRLYEKMTLSGFYGMYSDLCNAFNGCGTTVGFYYLEDYLSGKVPPARCTVFVNLWSLDSGKCKLLHSQILQRKGVDIWQYAPGFLDPEKGGTASVEALTGFKVKSGVGRLGSSGFGPLSGLSFGGTNLIDPRIIIDDPGAAPLAHYDSDGAVSAAFKQHIGIPQILIADCGWSPLLVSTLLKIAGIPMISPAPAVVQANQNGIFIYATSDISESIQALPGTVFENGFHETSIHLAKNDSLLLSLKQAP